MIEKKPNEFYTSFKISLPIKVFIGVLLVITLSWIGCLQYKTGKNLSDIITLIAVIVLCVVFIFWIFSKMRRLYNLNNLSSIERSYIDDLAAMKITKIIKRLLFPDLDIQFVLSFIIIVGDMMRKLLFYLFIGILGLAFIYKGNTIFDKIIILSLIAIWCPWLEDLLVKKVNYKLSFLLKLTLTATILSEAIKINP